MRAEAAEGESARRQVDATGHGRGVALRALRAHMSAAHRSESASGSSGVWPRALVAAGRGASRRACAGFGARISCMAATWRGGGRVGV